MTRCAAYWLAPDLGCGLVDGHAGDHLCVADRRLWWWRDTGQVVAFSPAGVRIVPTGRAIRRGPRVTAP